MEDKGTEQSTGYTAVDMTTAAAQGFRDGQASVDLAEYEALRKDAERYRFLRAGDCSGHEEYCATVMTDDQSAFYREDLDRLIDDQMVKLAAFNVEIGKDA